MTESVVEKCVRDNIRKLVAYQSARGTAQASQDMILLDAAENPFCPFDRNDDWKNFQTLNRYPEPQPSQLLSIFSDLYSTPSNQILLTRGSEEGIRLLLQLFCSPRQDKIIICPPTFGMYAIEAGIHDTEMIKIPRLGENYNHLDITQIVEQSQNPDNHVKLIFICNPGNPSSTSIPPAEVEEVIKATSNHCMVVVDEAYIDFASHSSFVDLLEQHPNLIILRTVSKGYGLAGLRCGTIIASEDVVSYLKRLTAAYPVPKSTEICGVAALSPQGISYMQDKQNFIKQERKRMINAISSFDTVKKLFPSDANFLCLQINDAAACVTHFAQHGIIIRNRSTAIPNTVNIAIGTTEQNDKVIKALESYGKK